MKKFFIFLIPVLFLACNKEKEVSNNDTEPQKAPVVSVAKTKKKFGAPIKFVSKDLQGNEVSEKIFQNADVTMVNIWATWCGPCRAELPTIGNISRKYAEKGYQVISFIHDVSADSDNAKDAIEILEDANCKYITIINDPSMDEIYADVEAFPTTFFVDKEGNLIGNEYIGAMKEFEFDARFQKAIDAVSK